MYRTMTVTVLYSLYSSTTIRPFHELEVLVGGGCEVCKPILVIGFARVEPQAIKLLIKDMEMGETIPFTVWIIPFLAVTSSSRSDDVTLSVCLLVL